MLTGRPVLRLRHMAPVKSRAQARVARALLTTSAQPANHSPDGLQSLLSINRRDEPPAMEQLARRALQPHSEPSVVIPGVVSLTREDEPPASFQLEPAPSPEMSLFAGARSAYTPFSDFWYPEHGLPPAVPCFRVLDDEGRVMQGAEPSAELVSKPLALALFRQMVRVQEFEKVFYEAQRQGRVPFFLSSSGEEACAVASAAALTPHDWLLPQYRELGAFLWRDVSFAELANQMVANGLDRAHGRQLPLHFGSRERRCMYVKSTLGTQCPHAAGAAYAMRVLGNRDSRGGEPQGRVGAQAEGQSNPKSVVMAYLGEGAASEVRAGRGSGLVGWLWELSVREGAQRDH